MSLFTQVPADVEPVAMIDLVDDCREVSGVLGLPSSHAPLSRHTGAPDLPVIDLDTVAVLEGWGAYGS
jgi:hypothetical protein